MFHFDVASVNRIVLCSQNHNGTSAVAALPDELDQSMPRVREPAPLITH